MAAGVVITRIAPAMLISYMIVPSFEVLFCAQQIDKQMLIACS
jgi:hypothetical protein